MSYFFSLRGWLEVEPEKFQTATKLIELLQYTHEQNTKIGLYLQGWSWNETSINWTRYLFYGADVTQEGIEIFENTIGKLIDTQLNVSGYFHAQGEDGERNLVYRITDDKLCIELGNILIEDTYGA